MSNENKELSIEIIAMTKDKNQDDSPEEIRDYMELLSGEAAGVCYMPSNDSDNKNSNLYDKDKIKNRFKNTQQRGHNSVQEHGHITFMIYNVPKIVAMVLNSIGVYNTSEKSARYTKMNPENKDEIEKYEKWTEIFKKLISAYYPDKTEKEIEKLAIENARYMISVFTPTTMCYTISYNMCKLIISMIDDLNNYQSNLDNYAKSDCKRASTFYKKLIDELNLFKDKLIIAIGGYDEEYKNPKGNKFRFLFDIYNIHNKYIFYENYIPLTNISDSYTLNYECSFACLAQLERHRTIDYFMHIKDKKFKYYIPNIIKNSPYEREWLQDIKMVDYPQGQIINVVEQGTIDNFVLKCKERLCNRAQYEICENTKNSLIEIYNNKSKLSMCNAYLINTIVNNYSIDGNIIVPRCRFEGYKCNEPCKDAIYGLTRLV